MIRKIALSFNPLFIRSVFLLGGMKNGKVKSKLVSIPYSSGQCFFCNLLLSLKQQRLRFNPLFIRSVFLFLKYRVDITTRGIMFQSLIHQVSVSFQVLTNYGITHLL